MQRTNSIVGVCPGLPSALGFLTIAFLVAAHSAKSQSAVFSPTSPVAKRPISVRDAIEMKQIVEDSSGRVAWFSPDGKEFVVVLKRGNLERNTNDFELLRYRTAGVFESESPELLLTMSSSSNGDAIKDVKWMRDNRTIVFLGERPGESSEVYAFDTREKRLRSLTKSAFAIEEYGISAEGREIVYITKPAGKTEALARGTQNATIVSEGATLVELLSGSREQAAIFSKGEQLSLQSADGAIRVIAVDDFLPEWGPAPLVSPDGKHAVVGVVVRAIPTAWNGYEDERLQRIIASHRPEGRPVFFVERYLLLDTTTGAIRPLLESPMIGFRPARWSADSRSVQLKGVYLPLDTLDKEELAKRASEKFDAEVEIETGKVRVLPSEAWSVEEPQNSALRITVRQSMTLTPQLSVADDHGNSRLLLDPNPEFASLQFGEVEVIEWEGEDRRKVKGELYKPPDFIVGKRYPLVIQTHGFAPNRFWMDGPWGSAFSARPLAANGIVVLQLDYDRSASVTPEEGRRAKASFEGAIDELDRRGMIDRHRVGISGFSRTVYHVEYALTHSSCLFAAANLVDGIDASYLQYLAFGSSESQKLNDGKPFGHGLAAWLANAPGFQLDQMRTPVRMQAHGLSESFLSFWEWFALLSEMQRPMELAYIADAPHILVKPQDKRVAQESLVDWFRFWLKREADHDPEKREQYVRWAKLFERSRRPNYDADCSAGGSLRMHAGVE